MARPWAKLTELITNHVDWWKDYMTEMSVLIISIEVTFYGDGLIQSYNDNQDDQEAMRMVKHELEEDLAELFPSAPAISPGSNDNLFIYWVGHGVLNGINWGKEMLTGSRVADILRNLATENCFRKTLFMVETCYSGQIGKACEGILGVLVMTAANAQETSKATNYDSKLRLWMSNIFSHALIQQLEADPHASIRELYYKLYNSTMGSHVTVYNQALFDNLYTSSVTEFIRP